ncbi:ImmA/IrrE family metallo-endopeptidase [Enterococcus devriesei]|uniref:ImmA/IrrE family metallo-endopeptidase n=1 Tax=Enterococcus devriesei TaxID=319970 RepID=UPI0028AED886|nr:ImmA/IrrE family metallo-endopeptidase [Enterococcus devriesei]
MQKLSAEKKEALKKEVEVIALRFRSEYSDIANAPIPNSFMAAEELGFFVVSCPAPDKLSGMTMNIQDKSMIVVNSVHPLGRQNYSIWHEVYHWYTEDGQDISLSNDVEYSETEYKAELFAAEILMEKSILKIHLNRLGYTSDAQLKFLKKEDIVKLQNIFQVSYKAILTRIISLTGRNDLGNRYAIASSQSKIIDFNKLLGYSGNLEKGNLPKYISPSFFIYLENNLSKGRISKSYVNDLLKFVEEDF